MMKLYALITLFILGVFAQEKKYRDIAPTLRDCYDNAYLLEKDNRLPHTLNTLIAIIRKIENAAYGMNDLPKVVLAITHRYRQDGIIEDPNIPKQSGVSPYASDIDQFAKYFRLLSFIPERDDVLPQNIITDIERCTLHFMLSGSIEIFERGDEGTVCRFADNAYRRARSVSSNHSTDANIDMHDVETLTPEQIDVITSRRNGVKDDASDPNALYPELPPNHPESARVLAWPPISRCPVENGVIKTHWGPVSAGILITAIAAGLRPEKVPLLELFKNKAGGDKPYLAELTLDNRWFATLAGDLAEVVLIQGPMKQKLVVGANGNWNSSSMPRWYFLNSHEKLEFTAAEIRGGLDGLIIANEIESLYSKVPTLKLSQILEMYYSARGLFDSSIKACNRGTLFPAVAQNSTMSSQAYSASLVLKEFLQKATMDEHVIKKFAVEAVNELSVYVPTVLSKDLSCKDTETGILNDIIQFSVDLTIILDTNWLFDLIQPILSNLLDLMKINQYNSRLTIINGHDGSIMLNTTSSILEFYSYNVTNYANVTRGFNFAKSLKELESLQRKKLNDERNNSSGNAKSDVILFIPYQSDVDVNDREYCTQQLKQMHEKVPDATVLILTYGSKERWLDFVRVPEDVFSIMGDSDGSLSTIYSLISRIKQIPQRMINTQCGADYSPVGPTKSFTDYIEPGTIVSYRMHPNYFFSTDTSHTSTITIEGSSWGNLIVCKSRKPINFNSTQDAQCETITNNLRTIQVSCSDASMIHKCEPLYVSIIANSSVTSFQCNDAQICKLPHMIKYTVSYADLRCTSSASINMLNIIVLIVSMIYIFL